MRGYVPRLLVQRIGAFRDDTPADFADPSVDRVNSALCAAAYALAWLEHFEEEDWFEQTYIERALWADDLTRP